VKEKPTLVRILHDKIFKIRYKYKPKVSPPRPSKSGVAFAEQSTKNSIAFPVLSRSSSAFTPTKTSVFASLK